MEIIYSRYEQEARTSKLRKMIAEYHAGIVYRGDVARARKEFDGEKYPLPWSVEVETINRCNNDCSFCPVNRNEKQRELFRMTEKTLDKILDELSDIGYTGILQLFSNNEPLLDKEIYTRIRKARNKVPGAYMLLMTNGILIDINRIREMLDSLDMLVIDNYDDGLKMIPSVQKFYNWMKEHTEYEDKVEIHMRKKNEVLTSRGGYSPNTIIRKNRKAGWGCIYPYRQMVIRPDGKISLCCNDALGRVTLGDINEQSLMEIWKSEKYNKIREAVCKGRRHFQACAMCDTSYLMWNPKSSL